MCDWHLPTKGMEELRKAFANCSFVRLSEMGWNFAQLCRDFDKYNGVFHTEKAFFAAAMYQIDDIYPVSVTRNIIEASTGWYSNAKT